MRLSVGRACSDESAFPSGPVSDRHTPYGPGVVMRQAGDLSYFFLGVARKPCCPVLSL
jgi:hypothetical protein